MKIIDCFIETMAFTLHFTKHSETQQYQYDEMVLQYESLIEHAKKMVLKESNSTEAWDKSLFAICAWVDEKILLSNWHDREKWQRNPLQREYFRTTQAGEKFFEIYDSLDTHAERQIKEVFNYCIKLGFLGKNFHNPSVKSVSAKQETSIEFIEHNDLFPEAHQQENYAAKQKTGLGLRATLLITSFIAIIGLGVLDFAYKALLDGQVSGYFK